MIIDESLEFAESVINTVREPLIVLDQDLRVVKVSRSFYEFFKVTPEQTVGQLIYDLGNRQWDIPKLRELLEDILPKKEAFNNYEVEHTFATIGRRVMLLNARQIEQASGKKRIILLAIEDITERKEIEAGLEKTRKELAVANDELESFAYSVSHDLRAPLRSIDGFSKIIVDDYSDKVDEQGRNYLLRIKSATQKMGQLIDDLLKLSRITRQELKREEVDLSMMARKISAELSKNQQARQVEFVIKPGCTGTCDRQLIGIALENLIGNSWKYSSRHPSAKIEFGATEKDGKIAYFVRDDGAGFDPVYADKLFAPFQRLHTASEFPGNGIGLATIQRIVRKHGGSVWAEGQVEKGATFYFTLK